MTRRYLTVTLLLGACGGDDGGRQPSNENALQPGTLRFNNITPGDSVFLDGEEVLSVGLARGGNELLLAPGTYSVRITTLNGHTCDSQIVVRAGEASVLPACGPNSRI